MTKNKSTKKAFLASLLSLMLCCVMLIGTTFAWFTDSVTSGNNKIQAGNLDIELEYLVNGNWKTVKDASNIFNQNALWEPGHTEVVYLKLTNKGNLDLKYQLGMNIISEKTGINQDGETFKLSDYIEFGVVEGVNGETAAYAKRSDARAAVKDVKIISEGYSKAGNMTEQDEVEYLALVVYMPETIGNVANHDGTEAGTPKIELGLNVVATQLASEIDSFDHLYDVNAVYYDVLVTTTEELMAALEADYNVIGIQGTIEAEFVANTNSYHHGDVDFKGKTIVGVTDDATLAIVGGGVPDFVNINLSNLTFVDKGTYNATANEFMYQNFSGKCTFTNVIFADDIRVGRTHVNKFAGDITIKNCIFNSDDADSYALWIDGGVVNIDATTFNDIKAYGLIKIENAADLTVTNSLFCDEDQKGAIYVSCNGATVTASNNTYANCSARTIVVKEGFSSEVNENGAISSTRVEAKDAESLTAALENAGTSGSGNTVITLTDDIDLTGKTWTPINVDGYHGADIVTIDGNNTTITGLSAPLFAGGFAGGSGIVIKNLTIANSNIVSTNTLGSGAFIESIDSMDVITLENCHLLNSTVTGGAGSRTGGLIGWTAGYNNENDGPVKTYVTIKDCSVIGSTIKCDGSVGAIYGHAGNNAWTYSTVENCTVKNNTLESTDDGDWRVGVVVGTANVGELTISNIIESGNTLTQTGKTAPEGQSNLYGRFVPGDTGKLVIDGVEIEK